jgi:ABC-type transporter Mla subunit MlaD
MKSSRNLKVGVTLLVIALAVGVFALVVWAVPSSFGQMVMERMEWEGGKV